MNLYEYEGKLFFIKYNLILNSYLTNKKIYIKNYIYKIQSYYGSRKKNNGICLIKNYNDCKLFFKKWNKLKYKNNKVKLFLIEKNIFIKKEFYFTFFFINEFLFFIFSDKGGIEIESFKKINFLKIKINLFFISYTLFDYLLNINIEKKNINLLLKIFFLTYNIVILKKIYFLEINPLIIFNNKIYFLDCKIIILFKKIKNFSEKISIFFKINYIQLKGNICCIINGAGLALKILDLFSYNNIKCFNFIDLSGTIKEQDINNLFNYLILYKQIKVLFINIFGGIISCKKIINCILNLMYKNFFFKIILKIDGNDKFYSLLKIIKLKNIFIEKNINLSLKKSIILNNV
ncbi:ATP-grasp domain-containing protein [Candidatus Carsonella ruddii]|uniref:Succinyl-CoA synthetase beta subunit n=1 Tax=Candidatus Carsonella ruddii CE isolate Thao2000 TaxID=1202536 RepID=J7GW09_CARRU|nr:ATP-grasp domain-containing protein [Candidatus Carsonella ruddii]AFP83586.1 succinyl-CoA synthetase beta subunit [Candidatus Carsonella ruddii CE isolate Thao2000]